MATKKVAAKKVAAKKTATKKAATKKAVAKKTATKSAAAKRPRKYGPAASAQVQEELHAMHEGKLRSSSGHKVTNPRQAIAIALSEARRSGAKMPSAPKR